MAKPVLHARDHQPGGADPIPGFVTTTQPISLPFYDVVEEIALTTDLLGYWRLGDGASPFADTSGHVGGAVDMVKQTGGTAMTDSIAGALIEGDDGAVEFNIGGSGAGDWLNGDGGNRFGFSSDSFTIACFVNPAASAGTFRGHALGNFRPGASGSYPGGYAIFVDWPTRTVRFIRAVSGSSSTTWDGCDGGSLTAGDWAFIVGTYDGTADEMNMYVDGALIDTAASTISENGQVFPSIGRSSEPWINYVEPLGFMRPGGFLGGVDEASIWDGVLTPEEVASLWSAASASATALAGTVPVADGAGGYDWGYPAIEVTY